MHTGAGLIPQDIRTTTQADTQTGTRPPALWIPPHLSTQDVLTQTHPLSSFPLYTHMSQSHRHPHYKHISHTQAHTHEPNADRLLRVPECSSHATPALGTGRDHVCPVTHISGVCYWTPPLPCTEPPRHKNGHRHTLCTHRPEARNTHRHTPIYTPILQGRQHPVQKSKSR